MFSIVQSRYECVSVGIDMVQYKELPDLHKKKVRSNVTFRVHMGRARDCTTIRIYLNTIDSLWAALCIEYIAMYVGSEPVLLTLSFCKGLLIFKKYTLSWINELQDL